MTTLCRSRVNVIGLSAFSAAYPLYATTRALDDLRARDYPLLDSLGHVYLDYTAGNLVPLSLVERHLALLRDHLLGNPHSTNPASALSTTYVEQTRLSVLDFFNADPDEYVVIFTANATQALKLVGEAYPFEAGGEYLLTFDNHNSVNGIREFARVKGCATTYVPIVLPDMRVDAAELASHLARQRPTPPVCLSGPIELLRRAASARLDSAGAGAGLGCATRCGGVYAHQPPRPWTLEARLRLAEFLQNVRVPDGGRLSDRPQEGVGEAASAMVRGRHHHRGVGAGRQVLSRRRSHGFRGRHAELPGPAGGRVRAQVPVADRHRHDSHARALSDGVAHRAAQRLRHADGAPLARIYGPRSDTRRGGTVTFNFYDRENRAIDHRDVEERANASGISLRTGCFCNPGGGEIALGITGAELSSCFRQAEHETHLTIDDFRLCIDGKSTGAVRVSLGLASNLADVDTFITFASTFLR